MGSKVVVLLGLSLAVFLLIASEVTAREMAETTPSSVDPKAEKASGVDGYGGGYGHGGHGGGGYGHGGHGGGGGGYHGGCKHGCCGHGYHGGCKCCSYKGQAVDAGYVAKP
ncbi:glycine-rich protein-like [Ipomoea triloba]|uniref:glycine-rich protein-like n=1 Tax=Ipomoea triloba TaxID=35885 RepID=UPI00125E36F3|nr:glycine-rich protein-like [Ipomoea triloba]